MFRKQESGHLTEGLFSLSQSEYKSDKPRVSDCKIVNGVQLKMKKGNRIKRVRSAELCARECFETARCKGWTFVRSHRRKVCIIGKTFETKARKALIISLSTASSAAALQLFVIQIQVVLSRFYLLYQPPYKLCFKLK